MLEIELKHSLSLDLTLDSGQCFRWKKIDSFWYGVVNKSVLKCKVEGDSLLFEVIGGSSTSIRDIRKYFNLDCDYSVIINSIRKDSHMEKLLDSLDGLTILKQDPYETLLSYILTANNNVDRVKKMVSDLSLTYGKKIETNFGDFYTFPTPFELRNVEEDDYRNLKFGFRSKYFKAAIDKLQSKNNKSFWKEASCDKKLLTEFYGVGEKIADCTLIFSLGCDSAVPVDVWIRRILTKLYKLPDKMNYREVQDFAIDYFGKYAGWAQMFLFVGGRNHLVQV